ncbi:MAG: ornithine carbamoyltransferase [Candidatus Nanohaloarchaea archaeon]|nr:ornithine carbamoyltransferase [Candidatus Nanohaloarchaea archaeon]
MNDLLDIADLSTDEIEQIYEEADRSREHRSDASSALQQQTLLMVFAKPSTRTRISFETGMTELGGHAIHFLTETSHLERGEALKDTSKVVSRYVDGVMARLYDHEELMQLAEHADVPVINGLTDRLHPCQALSDLYTLREKGVELEEAQVVFVGDGNNVAQSLIQACAKLGVDVTWTGPQGYELEQDLVEHARSVGVDTGASITVMHDPHQAVRDADVLYTDVFESMGEDRTEQELERFRHYQVDSDLLKTAGDPYVMHPLPAHRGEEITSEVLDSDNSIVYDQAENRLHVQKGILMELLG